MVLAVGCLRPRPRVTEFSIRSLCEIHVTRTPESCSIRRDLHFLARIARLHEQKDQSQCTNRLPNRTSPYSSS
jgi:hypothetical protein